MKESKHSLLAIAITLIVSLIFTLIFNGVSAPAASAAAAAASSGSSDAITGTYTGTAQGKNGDVTVEVAMTNGAIDSVTVTEQQETKGVADPALETLPQEIADTQSLALDTIAGCTITSQAILDATANALESAGADVDAFKNRKVENTAAPAADIEETYDVVIVGAGGAGLAAASAATEEGASVVVLDKMPNVGGNTALGEGTYNVADEALLKSTGAKTTPDLEKEIEDAINETPKNDAHKALQEKVKEDYEAWKAEDTDILFDSPNWHALQTYTGGGEIGDLPLIETYADKAVDTFQWLTDDIGIPFKTDYIFMAVGGKWQRGHQIDLTKAEGAEGDNGGHVYIDMLKKKAEDLGAVVYTDAKVTEITSDNGRASGAIAERSDGSKITAHANKAVIITTGGFAANPDLVSKYSNGTITTKLTSCAKSSTGDGIALAEALGANFVDMDQIQVHPLGDPTDGCVAEFVGNWLGAQYYVFVNKEGKRFVKEDGTRYEMSMAELQQTDGEMYLIVDSSQITPDRQDQIDSLIADGHTVKADTIEELADKINVDPDTLKETIDTYNAGMEAGKDEFGKAASTDSEIKTAPFYASIRTTTVHHTMGGVQIDTEAHVLDTDGNIIPGLYAAGEFTGGIHGNNRLGGNAYPDIMTFGRIAGTNAANETN